MSMELVTQDIFALEESFNNARADANMKFATEANFALQVLSQSDYLLKIASDNRQSLADAVMNVASIGISLNPARKQAYLVPRKGAVCLDISYRGLVDMATQSGAILWVRANVVREQDDFRLTGFDTAPIHAHNPFATDRGEIVGAYAIAKTAHGDCLTHTITIAEVYAIRNRSEGWKAGKATPWRTDEIEMIRKTVVKQASKYWPNSEPLDRAINYLNTAGGEGIEPPAYEPDEPRGKPAVQMPRAHGEVTDVEPKGVVDRSATQGEINWVAGRMSRMGIELQDACGRAGIELDSLERMTRADFVALREVLA